MVQRLHDQSFMYGGPSTNRHESHSQQHQREHQASASGAMPPFTVLIVEDEGVSRNALRKLLAASGYHAAAYECAEDALREVAAHDMPPVALIDVDLPGMSGLDLATRLEELRPDMVKVLITAASGDRIENFRRDHEVHYIRKPLDFPRLLRLLRDPPAQPRSDC
jgi:DNA-binding NtrC family response regulator